MLLSTTSEEPSSAHSSEYVPSRRNSIPDIPLSTPLNLKPETSARTPAPPANKPNTLKGSPERTVLPAIMTSVLNEPDWDRYASLIVTYPPTMAKLLQENVPINAAQQILEAVNMGKSAAKHGNISGPKIPANASQQQISALWTIFNNAMEQASLPVTKTKIADPEHYSGNMTKFQTFISQCALRFAADSHGFKHDQAKMAFAISFLRGDAYSWAQPHINPDSGHVNFTHYAEFVEALRSAFDDPDAKATAHREIYSLTQTGKCSTYYAKFYALTCRLGWNDPTYTIPLFERGLKAFVKDAIAINCSHVPRTSLETFANYCQTIDNAQFARQVEKRNQNRTYATAAATTSTATASTPTSAPASTPANTRNLYHTPMEVDRLEIRNERRQKRQCFYCGQEGHWIAQCTLKTRPAVNTTNTETSTDTKLSPESSDSKN